MSLRGLADQLPIRGKTGAGQAAEGSAVPSSVMCFEGPPQIFHSPYKVTTAQTTLVMNRPGLNAEIAG